jgi:FOG: EAL domain
MRHLQKLRHVGYGLTEVAFACFLIGGLFYVFFVWRLNNEQSVRFVNDATLQRKAALSQQFEGDLQVLRGVALSFSEMGLDRSERVYGVLDTINRSNAFVRMGVADLDGRADLIDLDGRRFFGVDLAQADFFRRAKEGMDAVSATFYDESAEEYVNYYAVPVVAEGRIAAVICAVNGEHILRDILDVPVFRGAGVFFVLDADGSLVVPPVRPVPQLALRANLLDAVNLPADERERVEAALAANEACDFRFALGGRRQIGVLQPLDVNGWFVLSAVPYAPLSAYYNQTAVGVTMLLLAASFVFAVLMYRQYRMMRRSQAELERVAYVDELTGVRNIRKFVKDAEAILRSDADGRYALWSFDIKRFGRVNELYGNVAGDDVIRRITRLFLDTCDERQAIFCHNFADQFTGIRRYETKDDLCRWYGEIAERLADRAFFGERRLRVETVMGFYCPEDFQDVLPVDLMVNRAAEARKKAKLSPSGGVHFFTSEMGERMRRELRMEITSDSALAEEKITFFLQPKVRIRGGYRIVGAEALVRWRHEEYGCISPNEFIPLFERNDFIVTMDRGIFQQVCRWYAGRANLAAEGLVCSINVSRHGLFRDDFVHYYVTQKERYGIPDGALELEFTESVALGDTVRFRETVMELQQNGFLCSIDDFGSGYSSLNILKDLPIDVLKLDALFFRGRGEDVRARAVVAGFLSLAKELGIQTVAEGIESRSQLEFLEQAGCDIVQGYIFSQALTPEEFARFDPVIGPDLRLRERTRA